MQVSNRFINGLGTRVQGQNKTRVNTAIPVVPTFGAGRRSTLGAFALAAASLLPLGMVGCNTKQPASPVAARPEATPPEAVKPAAPTEVANAKKPDFLRPARAARSSSFAVAQVQYANERLDSTIKDLKTPLDEQGKERLGDSFTYWAFITNLVEDIPNRLKTAEEDAKEFTIERDTMFDKAFQANKAEMLKLRTQYMTTFQQYQKQLDGWGIPTEKPAQAALKYSWYPLYVQSSPKLKELMVLHMIASDLNRVALERVFHNQNEDEKTRQANADKRLQDHALINTLLDRLYVHGRNLSLKVEPKETVAAESSKMLLMEELGDTVMLRRNNLFRGLKDAKTDDEKAKERERIRQAFENATGQVESFQVTFPSGVTR